MALLAPRFPSHDACTPSAVFILGGSSRDSLETFLQATVATAWVTWDDPLSYGGTQEQPCLGALLGLQEVPWLPQMDACHQGQEEAGKGKFLTVTQ